MLEGTDGRTGSLRLLHTGDGSGPQPRRPRTNRIRKLFTEGHPVLEIDELGDSESFLRNKRYPRETAQQLVRSGIVPQEDGWNGWLGRYQKALCDVARWPATYE